MPVNKFSYKTTEPLQNSFDIVITQLLTIIYKLKHTPFSVLGSTVVHFRTYLDQAWRSLESKAR